MAWNEASASCISSDGVARSLSFFPTAPRKSPITAMSGLKTLDEAGPYTGRGPDGPPAPAAPGGTSVGGAGASGDGSGDGEGVGSGDGDGDGVTCAHASPLVDRKTTAR